MWAMLGRLKFNVPRIKKNNFRPKVATMTERCHACKKSFRCVRWLYDLEPTDDPKLFCPNAAAFESLPRTLKNF
jgi:hypothetical protein